MGKRSKRSSSDFMTIIPKGTDSLRTGQIVQGKCVQQNTRDSQSQQNQRDNEHTENFVDIEHVRLQFLEAAGYVNEESGQSGSKMREGYKEMQLYLKAIFVWKNGFQKQDTQKEELLKFLVADRDMIFNDSDNIYRSRCLNAVPLSARKKNRREDKKERRSAIIENIKAQNTLCGNEFNEHAVQLLTTITDKKGGNYPAIYKWLYSADHVGITDENRDDYEARYQVDEDGYVCKNIKLPDSKRGWKRFLKWLQDRQQPWDTWCLDISKCAESFLNLKSLPQCDIAFWTREKTNERIEQFIQKYLAEYVQQCKNQAEKYPEETSYHERERAKQNLSDFQKRYERLSRLEQDFRKVSSELHPKGKIVYSHWSENESANATKRNIEIKNCIINFFEYIQLKLNDVEEPYILNRIGGVCNSDKYKNYEQPMYLLIMALACKRNITHRWSSEIELLFPCSFSEVLPVRQRLGELKLMDKLHQILKLTEEERLESWNLYLACQGKEIHNVEESAFWRKLLSKNDGPNTVIEYERLPAIGFQLCFLDYCDECLPPHYEKLSYQLLSKAQQGGYDEFLKRNYAQITGLSCIVERQDVDEYIKRWNAPEYSNEERRKFLKEICSRHPEYTVMELCPDEEYQCLVMETAIQMYVRKRAKEKILKWFDQTYGCYLSHFGTLDKDPEIYFPGGLFYKE